MAGRPALCDCGSGLRAIRCCAPDGTLPEPTAATASLIERAMQAHRRGETDTAAALCLEILDNTPNRIEPLRVLYEIRKAQGSRRAAEALLRRIVRLDPNAVGATNEIALMLMQQGNLAEAELHARNAVRIAPQNAQAHNLMGMILTESHRPRVGEYHYRRALDLSETRDPILLANLAWNLKNQGRMQEARALYRECAAGPDILQTLIGWSRMEEADRAFDEAARVLDRADRAFPDNPSVTLGRAVLLGRIRDYQGALALLDRVAEHSHGGQLGPGELSEKGRLLDRLGQYEDAFAAFALAKQRVREATGQAYLADQAQALIERLKNFFRAERLALLPRAGLRAEAPQPIFILGFPRSGTTLVEQTLSAHPRIAAGDELPFISEITGIMPRLLDSPLAYPEALVELWMGDHREDLDSLRDYYLQKARQLGILTDGAAWFTDKMPLNETHLGLIGLMFPASPMIHVVRHPLDVVLSVFSNHLTHGFQCAYALETAARHYVRIMELVEHYRGEMMLRLLCVRYEDVVDAQEDSVRRMLEFIGEDFDERCLNFHENRRYARTASYAQVSEQLYDRSRYRYRNYLKQLEPVIPILAPVIDRLGYGI